MIRNLIALTIAATATLLTVAGSAPAVAGTADKSAIAAALPTRSVSTTGIDLTSPAGRAVVTARVARAAAAVCNPGDRSLTADMARRACTAAAIAAATSRIEAIAAAQTSRNTLAAQLAPTKVAGAPEPTTTLAR